MEVQIRSCGDLYPVSKEGEARTNYRGPAAQKGARGPILIHVFVFLRSHNICRLSKLNVHNKSWSLYSKSLSDLV